jgi:hypothetical protein
VSVRVEAAGHVVGIDQRFVDAPVELPAVTDAGPQVGAQRRRALPHSFLNLRRLGADLFPVMNAIAPIIAAPARTPHSNPGAHKPISFLLSSP